MTQPTTLAPVVERKSFDRLVETGVLTAMRKWGDRHAAPDGPPMLLIHERCGETADAVLTCSRCGEPIGLRNVRAVLGPGARRPDLLTA